jgi:hypothetical protein
MRSSRRWLGINRTLPTRRQRDRLCYCVGDCVCNNGCREFVLETLHTEDPSADEGECSAACALTWLTLHSACITGFGLVRARCVFEQGSSARLTSAAKP